MDFDTLQKSHLILKILRTVCVLTNEKLCSKLPKFQPICYKLMLHVPATFTLTTLMWLEFAFSEDLNQATEVLYIAFTETALLAKLISVWYYDELVKSLFDEWQQNKMFRLQTTQECVMWQRTIKVYGYLSFLYIAGSVSSVVFAFAGVMFLDTYQLPFPCWTPFNWRDPSGYWYVYFYELLVMPLTCISNTTLDMFMCYMMQHLALHFKVLTLRLENLGFKKNETSTDITKKLVAIIKLHLKLKRMSQACEKIVSYPIFSQIFLSALVLCFSLYRLQSLNILEDPIYFLFLTQYSAVMTLQIFLYCFYGEKLAMESSALIKGVYNCNWPHMSTYNRKLVLQYMQSLQRPAVIKAGYFFNVDLTTFTKTMNNAYSFFALLLNMEME